MITPQITLLISSDNPDKLASFYSSLNCGSISKGFTDKDYFLRNTSTSTINIFKPSSNTEKLRCKTPFLSVCITHEPSTDPLSRLKFLVNESKALGAELIEGPCLEAFGAEAWLYDIDKNKFLIIVPQAYLPDT